MKVGAAIEQLKKFDPDLEIVVTDWANTFRTELTPIRKTPEFVGLPFPAVEMTIERKSISDS